MIRICQSCEIDFDDAAPERQRIGGLIVHCADCAAETTIKYLGIQSADGKQAQATILKFKNDLDRAKYLAFWQNNSGLHKAKNCQLGNHLSTTPGIQFETVQGFSPTNHKGKQ